MSNMALGPALEAHRRRRAADKNAIMTMVRVEWGLGGGGGSRGMMGRWSVPSTLCGFCLLTTSPIALSPLPLYSSAPDCKNYAPGCTATVARAAPLCTRALGKLFPHQGARSEKAKQVEGSILAACSGGQP